MIALLTGSLLLKELDRVEVMTAGGVGYECKHLPWYAAEREAAPEFAHYKSVSKWSVNI